MIILTSTDKIEIKLGGAPAASECECFASYRDTTSSSIEPKRNVVSTNSTTLVDLVGSPSASTQRVVDYFSVFNPDRNTATVTIQYNANSTTYVLYSIALAPGEKLEYQEGKGIKSFNNYGSTKLSIGYNTGGALSGASTTILSSDVVNNNAVANTMQDITGLSFSVTNGKAYWFRFVIPYTAAATTTGSRFSISGAAITYLYYESTYVNAIAAAAPTINQGLSLYDTPAAASASSTLSSNMSIIEGILSPSADGTLIARFASEVSSSAITAKAGAVVYYKELF